MHGLHLTADLHDCAAHRPVMTDPLALRALCLRAVEGAGLRPVGELFHRFDPLAAAVAATHRHADGAPVGGITGVILLAESHLAVHTWPEMAAVTLDVYVCNVGADNSSSAHAVLEMLIAAFMPGRVGRHSLVRGQVAASTDYTTGPASAPRLEHRASA